MSYDNYNPWSDYDEYGYNQFGVDREGFGYDGRDSDGFDHDGVNTWGFTKTGELADPGVRPAYSKFPAAVLQDMIRRLGYAFEDGGSPLIPQGLDHFVAGQRNRMTLYTWWTSGLVERASAKALHRLWANHGKVWKRDGSRNEAYRAIARHPLATVEMLEEILQQTMFNETLDAVRRAIARRGLTVNQELVPPRGYFFEWFGGECEKRQCPDWDAA